MRQHRFTCCVLLLLSLQSLQGSVVATELAQFSSDGCSLFPEGTPVQPQLWLSCCVEHDLAYWQGGSASQRQLADNVLDQCVSRQGQPLIGSMMRQGVRLGGSAYLPTSFRWGYGWPYTHYLSRAYAPLSPKEKAQVRARLQQWLQRASRHTLNRD